MKKFTIAAAAALLALAGPATAQEHGGHAQGAMHQRHMLTEQNRKVVEAFVDLFYRQHKVREAFETHVVEAYIQHNPLAPDGRAPAIAALEPYFASQPNLKHDVKRIIVDGDLAVVHLHATNGPGDRGAAIVDILRLENGKIVEHWDVFQPVPEKSANPHPMF